ncbi:exonuclease domain-containing protein [Aliiglaciecola sp. LCG003]|uniref:exonuclease domain-containing protein n=1 Tax=Aliiglaciecola sp. LCG003 TaxID=3053655 RepID=UPI0025744962|nr:exonuclease domain-containing protein [Aliiglaciecola sp. LCG003]WJG10327.1 exonuclease domain-containing protein [Aliiglaciecola sp. LCG003]
MRVLPSKYYLAHFLEFIEFISGPCAHLLDEQDRHFIQMFNQLEEDAKCLFVRGQSRKSPVIKTASLYYEELTNIEHHLSELQLQGFYNSIGPQHFEQVLLHLTKAEIAQVLTLAGVSFKHSSQKIQLLESALEFAEFEHLFNLCQPDNLLYRGFDEQLNYFLFLFFGDLNSGLQKFSMRDLGIMQTKRGVSNDIARFDFIDEAKSAYFYAQQLRNLGNLSTQQLIHCAHQRDNFPSPHGTLANIYADRLLFQLGKKLLPIESKLALEILGASSEPQAQEKVIRERYKLGHKDWVKSQLENIIDQPESETLLAFAEDFLARKFGQKRTSELTDMLREKAQRLQIDEIYSDSVENGVKLFYQKRGKQVFRTENRLWRALFGLVFWEELFEIDNAALVTEFDHKPQSISHNCFYTTFEQAIETRLYRMTSNEMAFKQVSKIMLEKYATPNGIFRWHKSLLEVLAVFFDHVDIEDLKLHLRTMAQDFRTFGDGYPDLMVVDEQGLRFEEIKAPGDQLRKNQLLTIKQLRKAQFNVAVTQVEWFLDPNQVYAVVDIETTGGRANGHRITEIGIAKVVGGKVIDTWQTLLNPQRHIPHKITQLTGISNDMVADAPLFVEVADKLRDYLSDCVFVAHNVNFDYGFIRTEFERLEQNFRMPKLCTVREMRKAVPGLPSYSLANLTRHFDIDMTQHHRALSDAQAAAELLFIINRHRHAN